MNERFRELREQAFDWVQQQLYTVGSDHPVMQNEQLEMINQKFAELIVRECAAIAKQTDGDESADYRSGRTWARIEILEHFGVEE